MNTNVKEHLYDIKKRIMRPEITVYNICMYGNHQFAPLFSDKFYLKCLYKKHIHKKLNLKKPKSFNEKLQWLKLYNRNPLYTLMSDKAEMKKYVSQIVGENYIIKTIGVYDSVDEVPFERLPEQYVIKCTHDSGSVFICTDKNTFNIEKVKTDLSKRLKQNYFWVGREWPYKSIKPRIIVEEFLVDNERDFPLDYKFFCFNGKMQFFKVDFHRFTNHRANYYDRDVVLQPFGEKFLPPDSSIELKKPNHYEEMVTIVEELAKDIPFVRVDLYYVNAKIYVGELTFFPASGVGTLIGGGDEIMGDLIDLPQKGSRGCRLWKK